MPMTSRVRVCLYARVSTNDNGQDPINQMMQLRSWAEEQGHQVVEEYVDTGSGAAPRAELQRLLADARLRHFQLVAVWSLDRFTREGVFQTIFYLQEMQRWGVRLFSLQEAFLDPRSPFYEVVLAVLAWVAAQERRRISERTKAGLARAVASGKRLGRPPGAKDQRQRKKSGYLRRWAGVQATP